MPEPYENTHRTVELNNAPEHAHMAAQFQRGKQAHLTAAEQTRRAVEYASNPASGESAPTTGHGIPAFSHDDIAAYAYRLWQARGCPQGSPEEDWFQAVKELRTRALSHS